MLAPALFSCLARLDLAGVLFRDEAEAAKARMFGTSTGAGGVVPRSE